MSKDDQMIMVVPRDKLFYKGAYYFQGFREHKEVDYEYIILANKMYMRRGDVEENPDFKQPIPYAVIINPELGVFACRRAKSHTEKRLAGNWFWGIGGHIEKSEDEEENSVFAGMLRELNEEVKGVAQQSIRRWGYINDDDNPVGRVHFGIVYLVKTKSKDVQPNDAEIDREWHGFRPISQLEEICRSKDEVDSWSRILVEPLKELKKLEWA